MTDRLTEIAAHAHVMANSLVAWDRQTGRDMLSLVQIAEAARRVGDADNESLGAWTSEGERAMKEMTSALDSLRAALNQLDET